MDILSIVNEYKIVDVFIVLFGLWGVYVMLDRAKALYFDLSMNTTVFMESIMTYLKNDRIDEAILLCSKYEKKPLGYVMKRMLEKAECDESDMLHSLDVASSEMAPKLVKRIGYLSMISNVVTLIGLLGTVVGLMMAFKAVGSADASQKSALLANGISMAMIATALGLTVAIPVMVAYSFLHDKQSRLFSELDRCTAQVVEHFKMKAYQTDGFQNGVQLPKPPMPTSRAS